MTPIKIKFRGGESLLIFAREPISFAESVHNINPPEIASLTYPTESNLDEPDPNELQEIKISLDSGGIIICYIHKDAQNKIRFIEGVESVENSTVIAYHKLKEEEIRLNARWKAVRDVINNIPNEDTRLYLHQEYLKRRRAYVAAVEALIEGMIRRPEE